jgi:hypothetical protein
LPRLALARRDAHRGLCRAACEGLTAAGLAYAEFIKLNGAEASADFKKVIGQKTLELKQQFDQIINFSDWRSNTQIAPSQTHWFEQLSNVNTSNFVTYPVSDMPWSCRFLKLCGCESTGGSNQTRANLMLLGLITSGVLAGLQNFQPVR